MQEGRLTFCAHDGIPVDVIALKAFRVCEFEHEGLEHKIDSVSDCLFGGGFKALL